MLSVNTNISITQVWLGRMHCTCTCTLHTVNLQSVSSHCTCICISVSPIAYTCTYIHTCTLLEQPISLTITSLNTVWPPDINLLPNPLSLSSLHLCFLLLHVARGLSAGDGLLRWCGPDLDGQGGPEGCPGAARWAHLCPEVEQQGQLLGDRRSGQGVSVCVCVCEG